MRASKKLRNDELLVTTFAASRLRMDLDRVPVLPAPCGNVSTEVLGKPNEDALGAADEAEPVLVLVLRDVAHERSAMGAQAREDVIEVVDGEHDAT
jgi:hypothetical protein